LKPVAADIEANDRMDWLVMKRSRLVAASVGAVIVMGASAYALNLGPSVSNLLRTNGHVNTANTHSHGGEEKPHDHKGGHDPADHPHQGAEAGEPHEHEGDHAHAPKTGSAHTGGDGDHDDGGHDDDKRTIAMAAEQIDQSKIAVGAAGEGLIRQTLRLPGTIIPDRNRVGRVPSKVVGTVVELKKGLGDAVTAGEVIAVLDSREVADAKSEYVAALVNFRLQETLYQREKTLWEKQVSSEQRLLRAEATFQEAQVRRDLARQKLSALGVDGETIAKISEAGQSATGFERYDIRAPIAGRIVEQLVDIGTPMGGDGQAHELYAIADLSTVWVELTVSPQDLPQIKEGQSLMIEANGAGQKSAGTIIFTSPLLNQETRSARVIASLKNDDGVWRPGTFVSAQVTVLEASAGIVIPKSAVQTMEGEARVFVRTPNGFEARTIERGRDDGRSIEVISGLKPGESIATENTFLLKAELGKSEAEHVH
jgi:membrane fusion protein, heavy metal efflux system